VANHSVVAGCGGDNGPVEPSGLSLVRAGPGRTVVALGWALLVATTLLLAVAASPPLAHATTCPAPSHRSHYHADAPLPSLAPLHPHAPGPIARSCCSARPPASIDQAPRFGPPLRVRAPPATAHALASISTCPVRSAAPAPAASIHARTRKGPPVRLQAPLPLWPIRARQPKRSASPISPSFRSIPAQLTHRSQQIPTKNQLQTAQVWFGSKKKFLTGSSGHIHRYFRPGGTSAQLPPIRLTSGIARFVSQ
jgi:hypothetical protein